MDRVRSGEPGEAEQLTRIALAAKRHWNYPEEWIQMWRTALQVTAEYVDQNVVYIWEADDSPAGFIGMTVTAEFAEIDHLWVLPAHMGRGIGKILVTRVLEDCRAKKVPTLWVASDPHAKDFYRKMGARFVGNQPSIPEPRTIPMLKFTLLTKSGRR